MPGQGIPPHVDTHSPFQEILASIGLKSGATMHFRNPEGLTTDLYLEPRSLVVMSGEARYNWLHSIAMRKIDRLDGLLKFRHRRVSLTFRKLKATPCACQWSALCDSQSKSVAVHENHLGEGGPEAIVGSEGQNATVATDMEKKHVYEVYEKIAEHFSDTRYKGWP